MLHWGPLWLLPFLGHQALGPSEWERICHTNCESQILLSQVWTSESTEGMERKKENNFSVKQGKLIMHHLLQVRGKALMSSGKTPVSLVIPSSHALTVLSLLPAPGKGLKCETAETHLVALMCMHE